MPTEDLTSDLNSEADFNDTASLRQRHQEPSVLNRVASFKANQPPNLISSNSTNRLSNRSNETLNHSNRLSNGGHSTFNEEDEIKTPDFDMEYRFVVSWIDSGSLLILQDTTSSNFFFIPLTQG